MRFRRRSNHALDRRIAASSGFFIAELFVTFAKSCSITEMPEIAEPAVVSKELYAAIVK
jgi:hypothetical protein